MPATRGRGGGGGRSVVSQRSRASADSKRPLLEQTFKNEEEKHQKWSSQAVLLSSH